MKSWRIKPAIGEKVRLKDTDKESDFSLQVERAALRSGGVIQLTYELWNGQPQFTRTCAPSVEKELTKAHEGILACAPDLDPVDLVRVMAKLEVDAALHEPQGKADGSADAQREQPSLSPPGFVCVALDEEGQSVYLLRNEEGTLDVVPSVTGAYKGETVTHVPPADLPWLLPRADAVLRHWQEARKPGWAAALLSDLEEWHRRASDLGRGQASLLLALHDFLTYIPELTDYLPILLLEAEPERGKTRTGQAAIYVSRHGMHLQGVREANFLRDATDFAASLFIDVMNLAQTLERKECTDLVLARFEKGGTVERVQYPERGAFLDIVRYVVYGPTIIATNEPIHRILDTRCLRIDMPLTQRRFSGRIEPEDARDLVERLMAWRAMMLDKPLAACEPPAHGRLGDILRPLRRVLRTIALDRDIEFDAIVAWQQKRRHDDLAQSTEAAIVTAAATCKPDTREGWLRVSILVEQFNKTRGDKPVPPNWLGRKARKMGWTIERIGHENHTSLCWDDDLLQRLQVRYGLLDKPTDAGSPVPESASHASHASQGKEGRRNACDVDGRDASRSAQHVSRMDDGSTRDVPPAATYATRATHKSKGVGTATIAPDVTPCPACAGTAIYRLMDMVFCTACWPDLKMAAEHVRRKRAEGQGAQEPAWEDDDV